MKKKPSSLNVANSLTLSRIVLVPVFVVLMLNGLRLWALLAFSVAALSDWLDGWVARRFKQQTALGEFIDPLADKLLGISALVTLAWLGLVPVWCMVLAAARELVVVTGFTLLAVLSRLTKVRPTFQGKLAAGLQMGSLILVLLAAVWAPEQERQVAQWVLGPAVVFSFITGLQYALAGIHEYEVSRKRPA